MLSLLILSLNGHCCYSSTFSDTQITSTRFFFLSSTNTSLFLFIKSFFNNLSLLINTKLDEPLNWYLFYHSLNFFKNPYSSTTVMSSMSRTIGKWSDNNQGRICWFELLKCSSQFYESKNPFILNGQVIMVVGPCMSALFQLNIHTNSSSKMKSKKSPHCWSCPTNIHSHSKTW